MSTKLELRVSPCIGTRLCDFRKTIYGDNEIGVDVELSAAFNGTLTSRISNSAGTISIPIPAGSQSYMVGDLVDVYWAAGYRRDVIVDDWNGNVLTISGDSNTGGDVLPAQDIAVKVMHQRVVPFVLAADKVQALVIFAGARAVVQLVANEPDERFTAVLQEAGVYYWYKGHYASNPLGGMLALNVRMTHADTAVARHIRISALYN